MSGVSNPGVGCAEWIHYLDSTIIDFSSRERLMASPNIACLATAALEMLSAASNRYLFSEAGNKSCSIFN